jgi:hypothetical protein
LFRETRQGVNSNLTRRRDGGAPRIAHRFRQIDSILYPPFYFSQTPDWRLTVWAIRGETVACPEKNRVTNSSVLEKL